MGSIEAGMLPPEYTGKELSKNEKLVRDLFVKSYLEDYSPVRAAIRIGFLDLYAKEYAHNFMAESYVQQRIMEQERHHRNLKPTRRTKAGVLRGLHEQANDYRPGCSHSARVAALSKLAQLYGMEPDKNKSKEDADTHGGVMMVPALESPDAWGKHADDSQQTLKEKVRE